MTPDTVKHCKDCFYRYKVLSLLMSSAGKLIHPWVCRTALLHASNCTRVGFRAVSFGLPSYLHSWGNRHLKWLNGIQFVSDPGSTLTSMTTSLPPNLHVISVMISALPSLSEINMSEIRICINANGSKIRKHLTICRSLQEILENLLSCEHELPILRSNPTNFL